MTDYATKTDLDNITHVDKSGFALETNLSSLKSEIDKLDISKLSNVPTDLSKLTNKVANELVEKTDFSALEKKVSELENKIKAAESKPDISNLANKTELKNVENKIPSNDAFFKKTDYATEISGIRNDYAAKAILDSKLSELKSQHIADEVKKIDDKTKKNSRDILGLESRLKQKEDIVDK